MGADVFGNADDLIEDVSRVGFGEALAERVLAGEVEARHGLVDDRHPERAGPVPRADAAALEDGDADHLEVVGADPVVGDVVVRV